MLANDDSKPKVPYKFFVLIAILGMALIVLAVCERFASLKMEADFGWSNTLSFLAPIFLAAAMVERATALIKLAWFGKEQIKIDEKRRSADEERALLEAGDEARRSKVIERIAAANADQKDLDERLASFFAVTSFVLGLLVSTAGFRILGHMVIEDDLGSCQKQVFIAADVLLTGVMIGGGAEPIRELMKLFKAGVEAAITNLKK